MSKVFSVLTLVGLVLTLGCGFSIRFGGEAFKNAVGGHMVLGIFTLVMAIAAVISVFSGR